MTTQEIDSDAIAIEMGRQAQPIIRQMFAKSFYFDELLRAINNHLLAHNGTSIALAPYGGFTTVRIAQEKTEKIDWHLSISEAYKAAMEYTHE